MLPTSLRIKGHVYTLRSVPGGDLGALSADCDNEANTIRISLGLAQSRKVEMVVHEVLHALLAGYDAPGEEALVVTLGEGLTAFLKDNPGFIRHALQVLKQP